MAACPSPEDMRREVERLGVPATDDDLELVLAFLRVLYPAFEELERLVPPGTVPAGLFVPAGEP